MLKRRSWTILTALSSILCFLSVAYFSCTKPGSSPSCNGVVCKNSGYCNRGHCVCPSGFEGSDCGTASVNKFIGTWDVTQITTASDVPSEIGKDSTYTVFLKNTSTPTTFFIDNFLGNPRYNSILCTLDSVNTNNFIVDTARDINMISEFVYIRSVSSGNYNASNQRIYATLVIRHLTATHNWQLDTYSLTLKRHDF